jgi:hypothetical protein
MMNWSEHEPESFPKPRPIILPLIFWLSSISLLILILAGLSGCASPGPRSEVCIMQMLGRTESGVPVVAMQCVTPEEFEESQK